MWSCSTAGGWTGWSRRTANGSSVQRDRTTPQTSTSSAGSTQCYLPLVQRRWVSALSLPMAVRSRQRHRRRATCTLLWWWASCAWPQRSALAMRRGRRGSRRRSSQGAGRAHFSRSLCSALTPSSTGASTASPAETPWTTAFWTSSFPSVGPLFARHGPRQCLPSMCWTKTTTEAYIPSAWPRASTPPLPWNRSPLPLRFRP
mmetsp:Transcript_802/g.2905  ORF Transcript_802/g.2905 Transcript_802/m.2905 type:complete len:202 (-) Transcript_802:78-683(-)